MKSPSLRKAVGQLKTQFSEAVKAVRYNGPLPSGTHFSNALKKINLTSHTIQDAIYATANRESLSKFEKEFSPFYFETIAHLHIATEQLMGAELASNAAKAWPETHGKVRSHAEQAVDVAEQSGILATKFALALMTVDKLERLVPEAPKKARAEPRA